MKYPKLYALSSTGKIKVWEIEADGAAMITRHGYEDGKMQITKELITGVNVGRSNETSAEQQCVLECKSKWQKKVDAQYTPDKNNIKAYTEQEILLPMLALKYQDRKHDIKFPCYVQPKLNGARCIYQNGKFMSRGGKEYTTLDHLVSELEKLGIETPDGEIYVHGMSLQTIISRVKEDKGDPTDKLEYWIYDQINNYNFEGRTKDIREKFTKAGPLFGTCAKVVYVKTFMVNSDEEIKKYHDEFVQAGFEGIIIRNADGFYKVKHRSKDLQKYKEFVDDEFIIIGGHEGTGSESGTVVFEVKTKEGKVFSVRPRGTRDVKTQWLKDLKNITGKKLTVRYQNLSDDGVPIVPVGICIRDYE